MQPDRAGPAPPKYGSACNDAGLAEVDANGDWAEGVSYTQLDGNGLDGFVGGRAPRLRHDAEHALGQLVILLEIRGVSAYLAPVIEESIAGAPEGLRVDQAATAHATSAEDHDVFERCDPQNALQTQLRRKDHPAQLREPLGEVVVLETTPGLQNGYPITLLGQAQRRYAAAEAGSDNQVVVVVCLAHHRLRSAWELVVLTGFATVVVWYSPESGSSW